MKTAIEISNLHLDTRRARVNGRTYQVPILHKPYTQILKAFESERNVLGMNFYHGEKRKEDFCATVQCLAGETVLLCGLQGYKLEEKLGCPAAAEKILRASSPLEPPSFFHTDYEKPNEIMNTPDSVIKRRVIAEIRKRAKTE